MMTGLVNLIDDSYRLARSQTDMPRFMDSFFLGILIFIGYEDKINIITFIELLEILVFIRHKHD